MKSHGQLADLGMQVVDQRLLDRWRRAWRASRQPFESIPQIDLLRYVARPARRAALGPRRHHRANRRRRAAAADRRSRPGVASRSGAVEFTAALDEQRAPSVSLSDNLRTLDVVLAMIRSSEERRRVPLPSPPDGV